MISVCMSRLMSRFVYSDARLRVQWIVPVDTEMRVLMRSLSIGSSLAVLCLSCSF